MWKWLEQYFTFTKSERNAIVFLIVLSAVVLIFPKVYFYFRPVEHISNSKYDKEVADFVKEYQRSVRTTSDSAANDTALATTEKKSNWKKPPDHYFDFDPNKIGVKEWVKLGFTEKQALVIEHYKQKGAKFYKPTDLKRLFMMTDEHYEKLAPYVKIDVSALPPRDH